MGCCGEVVCRFGSWAMFLEIGVCTLLYRIIYDTPYSALKITLISIYMYIDIHSMEAARFVAAKSRRPCLWASHGLRRARDLETLQDCGLQCAALCDRDIETSPTTSKYQHKASKYQNISYQGLPF